MVDLEKAFLKFDDEYLESELDQRDDLCAFSLLDRLCPSTLGNIIEGSDNDTLFLNNDFCEELARNATEKDIQMLVRCGVIYDEKKKRLFMFV